MALDTLLRGYGLVTCELRLVSSSPRVLPRGTRDGEAPPPCSVRGCGRLQPEAASGFSSRGQFWGPPPHGAAQPPPWWTQALSEEKSVGQTSWQASRAARSKLRNASRWRLRTRRSRICSSTSSAWRRRMQRRAPPRPRPRRRSRPRRPHRRRRRRQRRRPRRLACRRRGRRARRRPWPRPHTGSGAKRRRRSGRKPPVRG